MPNFAALRAAVFPLSTKNLRGADIRPPVGARVNPRRAGGVFEHPSAFLQIAEKRRRRALPFSAQLFIHLFLTLCENFRPRSLMVRSRGHVK